MAHVTVTINGKAYRMACDEGQEPHLLHLSDRFNAYVSQLKGAFGEIGDQRLTVMAAIMVTDELQELEKRISGLEADIATLKSSRDDVLGKVNQQDRSLAIQLSAVAERMETLAKKLAMPNSEIESKRETRSK